jgi:hypothetical protein
MGLRKGRPQHLRAADPTAIGISEVLTVRDKGAAQPAADAVERRNRLAGTFWEEPWARVGITLGR